MLLIKNGRVIDPVTHTDEVMDVLIDGNHIVKTGYDLEAEGHPIGEMSRPACYVSYTLM